MRYFLKLGAGAAAVAIPFVLPAFLVVTGIAILYAEYQGLGWVHAVFLGVGPTVLAIIAIAAYKLARSTARCDPVLWGIALILGAITAVAGAEIVWLFLAAGAFGAVYYGAGCRGCATARPRCSSSSADRSAHPAAR